MKFKCPLQIKCRPCAHSENITTSINTSSNTPSDEPSVSTNLGPVALDCEMVGVGIKKVDALGRVSIVDYEGQLLYDAIVHPEEEITDYRTPWSGIRQEDMSRAIEYSCAREHVQSIIQNRILVGHSLNRDLHVLNLEHPSHLVRDIAKVQYPKLLAGFLVKNPIGLRALTIRLFG
ncbi:unnamed protein product [Trichobilharzia regenti]|nr:unnamed protein product [Trichobilharzia regenti]